MPWARRKPKDGITARVRTVTSYFSEEEVKTLASIGHLWETNRPGYRISISKLIRDMVLYSLEKGYLDDIGSKDRDDITVTGLYNEKTGEDIFL